MPRFPLRILSLMWLCLGCAAATGTPAGTVISNTAVFDSDTGSVTSPLVRLTVQAICALNLTPTRQSLTTFPGTRVTFAHRLDNTGNSDQTFRLASTPGAPSVSILLDTNGDGVPDSDTPVTQVTLAADASVGLLLSGVSPLGERSWTVTASCADPAADQQTATDHLSGQTQALQLTKELTTPALSSAGTGAHYRLTVRNPNAVALSSVTVTDALPSGETFVRAEPAPTHQVGSALTWTFPGLPPGAAQVIELQTVIAADVADDTLLTNTAQASSPELPGTVEARADLRVFSTRLLLQKTSGEHTADLGDLLHYTVTLTNPSATPLQDSVVEDTPAAGLVYLPGSTRLDGQPAPDPARQGGTLMFQTGPLGAGASHTVAYTLQVTPQASAPYDNVASGHALGAGGAVRATVLSNTAQASVARVARLFGGLADVIGRVYVDRSRAGHFVEGTDTPVAGARILLAGGQEALTDAQGRYHFAGLTPGHYALRLDPGSAPWAARPWAGDAGLTGSRSVDVWGLTDVDFPLAPNRGSVQ